MEPIQNSEDECETALELRQACCKPFDGRRYRKDFRRCFTELSKVVTLSEAYRKHEVHSRSNSNLSKILVSLDSILIPNSSNYKFLLSNIPGSEISKKISKNIFFQMKSFEFNVTTGRVLFKPLFSLEQLELPASEYIVITLATKAILLLIEVAQLELWAARFYTGLGYAGFAQEIAKVLLDKFKNLKDCFMFLHHIISYVVLTSLSDIKILEHSSCNCSKQIDEAFKSCKNIHEAMSDIGINGTPENEMILSVLVSLANEHNKTNVITSRRLNVISLSLQVWNNAYFIDMINSGTPIVPGWNVWNGYFDLEVCEYKSPGDLYLLALKYHAMGASSHFLATSENCKSVNNQEGVKAKAEATKRFDKDADLYDHFATHTILLIDQARYKENEHYQWLYSAIKVFTVLRYLRTTIIYLHTSDPTLKFNVYKAVRKTRKDIEKDELLLAEVRDKLAVAMALVNLYLSNTGYNLMSYNNGEHSGELRQGLVESKEVVRELLPKQDHVYFCCFVVSDMVQSWYFTEHHATYGCFDLDPILIMLKCMAIVGKVLKPHGRSFIETLRGPVNHVSLANGVEIDDSEEVLTKNKHRSVYSVQKTPEGTLECEFYVNLENRKRKMGPDDKDASDRREESCILEEKNGEVVPVGGENGEFVPVEGESVKVVLVESEKAVSLPEDQVPPNMSALPKVSTNVCRVPNKQSSAKNSSRCNTLKMNHTVEYLPPRSILQTVACKHLYELDYSLYAPRFLKKIRFTRGSPCFVALKNLICSKINIALLNEDLVGGTSDGADSGCSRDPAQQSLYERLSEALSIMSRTADTLNLILEMIIEASDVMGITTEFDEEEEKDG